MSDDPDIASMPERECLQTLKTQTDKISLRQPLAVLVYLVPWVQQKVSRPIPQDTRPRPLQQPRACARV